MPRIRIKRRRRTRQHGASCDRVDCSAPLRMSVANPGWDYTRNHHQPFAAWHIQLPDTMRHVLRYVLEVFRPSMHQSLPYGPGHRVCPYTRRGGPLRLVGRGRAERGIVLRTMRQWMSTGIRNHRAEALREDLPRFLRLPDT